MVCDTCVDMTQLVESMGTELVVLKSRNKSLVSVNRGLFDRVKALQIQADLLMEELCKDSLGADENQMSLGLDEAGETQGLG